MQAEKWGWERYFENILRRHYLQQEANKNGSLQDWDQTLICSILKENSFIEEKPAFSFGDKESKEFLQTSLTVVF